MRTRPSPEAPAAPAPRGERRRWAGQAGSTAAAWGACAALALGSAAVQAETSPWYVGVSQAWTYDANLMRLADVQDTPEGYSRADHIRTTSLMGGMDQPLGRQRVYGSLNLRESRYRDNPRFDNTNYSAQLALDWTAPERLSGSVSGFASRSLQNFAANTFAPDYQKDLESTRGASARLALGLVTAWSLEASGSRREVRNSLQETVVLARDFDQDSASLGLRWRPGATGSLGLSLGATQGRYPNFSTDASGRFVADRFRRRDLQLLATHAISGASSLEARLASGRTTYDLNQRRNFSGVTGSFSWTWQASGKLRSVLSASRDTGQDSYATLSALRQASTADYSRVNAGARLQLEYLATAKFNVGLSWSTERRDLVRTIDDPFIPESASGTDRTRYTMLTLRWAPVRSALLGCEFTHERRIGEGQLATSMRTHTATCYGQLTVQ